jgi:flagellar hook-length control protein FliK
VFSVTSEPNANISFRSDPPRASGAADGSQPNGFATLVDDNAAAATQNDRSAQSSPPPAVARQDNNPSPQPPSRETAADADPQSSRGDPSQVPQKPDRDAPQSKVDNPGKRGKAPVKSEAAKGKADTAASASNPGTSTTPQAASQIQPDAIAVPPVVAVASTDTVPVSDASGSSSPLKIAAAAIAASAKVAAAADTPSPVASSARDSASTVSAGDSAAVTEAVAAAASDIAATNFKIAKDIETAPAPVVAKAAADAAETLDAQQKLGVAVANPTDALVKTTLKASTSERHDDAATAVAKALNPDSSTTAPSSTPQPTNDGANAQPVAAAHPKSNDAEVKPKPDGVDGNAAANSTTAAPTEHRVANAGTQPASMPFDPGSQTSALPQPQVLPTTTPATVPASQLTAAVATSVAVPLNGLAVQIAATAQGGRSRFEIRLDPAELGRIDVRLDVDRHGQVTSHLVVEKPETLAMLRQDAPQLQRALEDAGLKTGNNGLQFSLRDQSSSGNQNGDNHSNRNTQHLIVGDTESLPSAVVGKSYGSATGSTRGLDIRV